jgi:hypothetical protein
VERLAKELKGCKKPRPHLDFSYPLRFSYEVYGEYFETLLARSTVKVAEPLMGVRVEIEAVAVQRS